MSRDSEAEERERWIGQDGYWSNSRIDFTMKEQEDKTDDVVEDDPERQPAPLQETAPVMTPRSDIDEGDDEQEYTRLKPTAPYAGTGELYLLGYPRLSNLSSSLNNYRPSTQGRARELTRRILESPETITTPPTMPNITNSGFPSHTTLNSSERWPSIGDSFDRQESADPQLSFDTELSSPLIEPWSPREDSDSPPPSYRNFAEPEPPSYEEAVNIVTQSYENSPYSETSV